MSIDRSAGDPLPTPRAAPDLLVGGSVTDGDGTPLTGATVTLTDPQGRQLDHTWTDEHGGYRLSPPTGGTYIVICASGRYQPSAALVAVADQPVRHDMTLRSTGVLFGSVRLAPQGRPVPASIVTLIDASGAVAATVVTGPDGGYELRDLAEGTYTLAVSTDGLQPTASSVTVPLGGRLRHDVELTGRCRLQGTVLAASSQRPVDEALVTLVDGHGDVLSTQLTGPDGRYDFDDLGNGDYTITASGYAPRAVTVRAAQGDTSDRDIALGEAGHAG